MKSYIIRTEEGEAFFAASKARRDAETIALRNGYELIKFPGDRTAEGSLSGVLRLARDGIRNWTKLIRTAEEGSRIMVQYPHYPMKSAILSRRMIPIGHRKKGLQFIALIHDLDSARSLHGNGAIYSDRKLLPVFDRIICHNEQMKKLLVSWGIPEEKLIVLGIFDYLTNADMPSHEKEDGITVAGNLSSEKCGYVQQLIQLIKRPLHLYGKGLDPDTLPENVTAYGAVPPGRLPGEIKGGFGLIWDGPEADCCAGPAGIYLRINNPHKLSLYLTAGMPVIIWEEAAEAAFVKEKGVGLTVKNLAEIEEKVQAVTLEEYKEMREKAIGIGKALRSGVYLQKALEQIAAE